MRIKTLINGFIGTFVLSVFILILLGCSSAENKMAIDKGLSDSTLKTLYGGCGWFSNPYCINGGTSCPRQTPCEDSAQNCCVCTAMQGTICWWAKSYFPDFDDCTVEIVQCPYGCLKGYCILGICFPGSEDNDPYPECDGVFTVCDD